MAERLKKLREEKGLSHERLSKALFEQYGVKISRDSLMNYEATENHEKAGKNQGMRVEYLRCLSDFYGVSSDYILGISGVKSTDPDIASIVQKTGLSENAVKRLIRNRQYDFFEYEAKVINILIEDAKYHNIDKGRGYRSILNLLHFFFSYSGANNHAIIYTNGLLRDSANSNRISTDAIRLDDTIIENAVLNEAQRALISLKQNMKNEEK